MQWVCSLRDSLQGLDALSLAVRPTNRLPTSPLGAGHKGHREAPLLHLQLFKSSTGHSSMQIAKSLDSCAISRLPENSNGWRLLQPAAPVERGWFLWERGFRVHGIRAKLAGNFEVFWGNGAEGGSPNRGSASSASPRSPNSGFQGREITPRSVSPFTKNCMANATSNKPMILTSMRIPVSPSTVFTLPAPASTR